jgi:hypothetical protein
MRPSHYWKYGANLSFDPSVNPDALQLIDNANLTLRLVSPMHVRAENNCGVIEKGTFPARTLVVVCLFPIKCTNEHARAVTRPQISCALIEALAILAVSFPRASREFLCRGFSVR